jgi:DNA-binding transcriptional regulator GbsR (MarR family)
VARSNVSVSLKELQSWGLIRMVHVMGDRPEHFRVDQDITQLARVIIEGARSASSIPRPNCAMRRDRGSEDARLRAPAPEVRSAS